MSEITPNTPNPVREDAYKQQLAAKLGIDPQYIPGSPIWHSEEEIAAIAEMFSNMAGGSSGGGVLVVRIARNGDYLVCDKTASEIWTATQSGIVLLMFGDSTGGAIYPLKSAENAAVGYIFHFGDDYIATATNGTDYPKIPF